MVNAREEDEARQGERNWMMASITDMLTFEYKPLEVKK